MRNHYGITKYLLTREFQNRYFLELLELMKAFDENDGHMKITWRVKTAALRVIDAARYFRDNQNSYSNKKMTKAFNITRSRSCSNFPAAYNYKEWKDRLRLLGVFAYPYQIPDVLINTSFENEYKNQQYCHIIRLARKWIMDIMSGDSFFKRNKQYFTRKEASLFLSLKTSNTHLLSLVEMFFIAKCKARNMDNNFGCISNTLSRKFVNNFDDPLVSGLLDLLVRSKDVSRTDFYSLDDLCDFIIAKIVDNKNALDKTQVFSLYGKTYHNVIKLMNNWHTELIKEIEEHGDLNNCLYSGENKRISGT